MIKLIENLSKIVINYIAKIVKIIVTISLKLSQKIKKIIEYYNFTKSHDIQ